MIQKKTLYIVHGWVEYQDSKGDETPKAKLRAANKEAQNLTQEVVEGVHNHSSCGSPTTVGWEPVRRTSTTWTSTDWAFGASHASLQKIDQLKLKIRYDSNKLFYLGSSKYNLILDYLHRLFV